MKPRLMHIVKVVVIAEFVYLVLVNAALNLPVTQTLINRVKPDKFYVSWEKAWSLYPFRVHAMGIAANGQSRSQQWQVHAPSASASISLLPLLWRSVSVHDAEAQDVDYRQRPRPRADRDHSKTRAFFPPIEGRELETTQVIHPPPKTGKHPWSISVDNLVARGRHTVWLYQLQGKFEGELRADLAYQTRGGPFSLSNGEIDLVLQSLVLNGDQEVTREGHISGKVEFLPFVPRENRGGKSLAFLSADAEVRTATESLDFLNIYLANFEGMKVDGAGLLQGRLHLRQGALQAGSDIRVSARELSLHLLDTRLEGDGNIRIKASDKQENSDVAIEFASLDAFDSARNVRLFSGYGLAVEARGSPSIVPIDDRRFKASRLVVKIPAVEVPDLRAYQAYVPENWRFRLNGGKGKLQGSAILTQTGFNTNLRLSSEAADIGIDEYRFRSNLDMALKLDSPTIASGVDVSGSYLHLRGASLSNEDQQSAEPWQGNVDIVKGKVKLQLPKGVSDASFRELSQGLRGKDIVPLLHSGGEKIKITGRISDLSWLGVLLKNRFDLGITGSGEVTAGLVLSRGLPVAGSIVKVYPRMLGVDVLDYTAEGDGEVILRLEESGENPDMKITIALSDAMFKRKGEDQAFIENAAIKLQALERNMTFDGQDGDMELHLEISSAQVQNMSVYNLYLPPNSPLQFSGGKARLRADIKLTSDDADGYVKLNTEGLSARVDDQQVAGDLTAEITLIDGVPENMDFDISGSSITLDSVRIVGDERTHDDEDWSAHFELKKGRALWKRPIQLQLEADLRMSNSRPVVAVIANQRGKHGWLEKALTIDDVEGEARMNMAQQRIVIPYAFAGSDKIDVGAKGVISADERDGVFYVRYRKLHGILQIENGEGNIDV
jgi:hypothetical protein